MAVLCLLFSAPVWSQADKQLRKRITSIHKEEIKSRKKSEGFSKIEVKAYVDGYWYYQVTKKGEGGKRIGVMDSTWRPLVPAEYEEVAYYPPVAESATPIPRYYKLLNKTYPPYPLFHRAQPGAFVGTAPGKVAVYSAAGRLAHEYAAGRYDYLPGYIVVEAGAIDRTCYHKNLFAIENGKAIVEQGGRELATDFKEFVFRPTDPVCDCTKLIDGAEKKGKLSLTDTTFNIPCAFYLISKNEDGTWRVMRTRAGNWEAYDPSRHGRVTYTDKGEELFDKERYADVVAYYRQPGNECEYGIYMSAKAMYEMAHDEVFRLPSFCGDVRNGSFFITSKNRYADETFDIDSAAVLAENSRDLFRKYLELDTVYAVKARRGLADAERLLGKLPGMREQLASAYATIEAYNRQQNAKIASALGDILTGVVKKAVSKSPASGGSTAKPVSAPASAPSAGGSTAETSETSGGSDGAGSADTRRKEKCRACGGLGFWVDERISGEEKWCDRCGKARKPHTHKTCTSCDGKGWHY